MTPYAYWLYFHLALVVLLAAEYTLHRLLPDTRRKAMAALALWTTAALLLAAILAHAYGFVTATQYLAGYTLEEALSIDNLFVFLLLFNLFRIQPSLQPKVLFWGVLGAILMRGAFILGGLSLLAHFQWISYVFAVILLIAAVRLLKPEPGPSTTTQTPSWILWLTRLHPISERTDKFFVREAPSPNLPIRRMATILFLALVAVELTDVVFALDSIPAVLSITRDPFLAYTSNIMAVMGLRSLYVLLAVMLSKLRYMHFGLAVLLVFASLKMLIETRFPISPIDSLAIIATILALTITASLLSPIPTTE